VTLAVHDEEIAKKLFGHNGVLGPLKEYFGNGSGGRTAIGGSPREEKIDYDKFILFVKYIKSILKDVDEAL
jgi:hypothetical protein